MLRIVLVHSRMFLVVSILCYLSTTKRISPVESLSTGVSTGKSPWATASWILTLDLGSPVIPFGGYKRKEDDMNGRIVTKIPVDILADDCIGTDTVIGRGASVIEPQSGGTYMTMQGEQPLELSSGGWTLALRGKSPKASQLQFWMELTCDVQKNDLRLPQGQRLYFSTLAWREQEYEKSLQKIKPIHSIYQQAQDRVESQVSHETGDRRLDGKDALETLQAYGDMAQLVLERDLKRNDYMRALEDYPPLTDSGKALLLPEGPWPGSEEWLILGPPEQNPILVATPSKGFIGGGPETLEVVGTWTAEPILSDDDFEYVDDDQVEDQPSTDVYR